MIKDRRYHKVEKFTGFKNVQIVLLGLFIAVATICSTLILSKTVIQTKKFSSEVISVTGSAEKDIKSDYIVWRSRISIRDKELKKVYDHLKKDLEVLKAYLLEKGIKADEIVPSQIYTETFYVKNPMGYDTMQIEGYQVSQTIEVRSSDVQKIDSISRESTELLDKGLQFISDPPQYFYTKLADLKITMLEEATTDSKKREETIAKAAGNKNGMMRSAKWAFSKSLP